MVFARSWRNQTVRTPNGEIEPIHPERGMVRNLVVQIELAGPAVSKVQRHFLAQAALMTNAMSIRIIGWD